MNLTIINRLKLCLEILTTRSGHIHIAHEKQLSVFQHGYQAGMLDQKLSCVYFCKNKEKKNA